MIANNTKTFVISDLHLGDGGPRDNFAVGSREAEFMAFLKYVEREKGQLVVAGDLFEFWQSAVGSVLKHRLPIIARLEEMDAVYVPGNHDADLEPLIGAPMLGHPFFGHMVHPFTVSFGSKTLKFAHGHESDPFNKGVVPGWGRIMAIFAGIQEDRNGSPLLPSGQTVEDALVGFGQVILECWDWLVCHLKLRTKRQKGTSPGRGLTPAQKPSLLQQHIDGLREDHLKNRYDIVICGHTHNPGRFEDWYYNAGCWVGNQQTFLRINPGGEIALYDWNGKEPIPRDAKIKL